MVTRLRWVPLCRKILIMGLTKKEAEKRKKEREEKEKKKKTKERKAVLAVQKQETKQKKKVPHPKFVSLGLLAFSFSTDSATGIEGPEDQNELKKQPR